MTVQDRIQDGVPIGVAAARLGISVDAMRKRIRRRSLRAYKAGGHWYVILPASRTCDQDATSPPIQDARPAHGQDARQDAARSELVDQLRNENAWLRQRLEEAETERAEMRRLLLAHAPAARALPAGDSPAPPRPPWWRRLIFRAE